MLVRTSWRQVAYHLNGAGYYARRAPAKNRPGRSAGFSVREDDDGSVLLTYSSAVVADDARGDILAEYAAVLRGAGMRCELRTPALVVLGWN